MSTGFYNFCWSCWLCCRPIWSQFLIWQWSCQCLSALGFSSFKGLCVSYFFFRFRTSEWGLKDHQRIYQVSTSACSLCIEITRLNGSLWVKALQICTVSCHLNFRNYGLLWNDIYFHHCNFGQILKKFKTDLNHTFSYFPRIMLWFLHLLSSMKP